MSTNFLAALSGGIEGLSKGISAKRERKLKQEERELAIAQFEAEFRRQAELDAMNRKVSEQRMAESQARIKQVEQQMDFARRNAVRQPVEYFDPETGTMTKANLTQGQIDEMTLARALEGEKRRGYLPITIQTPDGPKRVLMDPVEYSKHRAATEKNKLTQETRANELYIKLLEQFAPKDSFGNIDTERVKDPKFLAGIQTIVDQRFPNLAKGRSAGGSQSDRMRVVKGGGFPGSGQGDAIVLPSADGDSENDFVFPLVQPRIAGESADLSSPGDIEGLTMNMARRMAGQRLRGPAQPGLAPGAPVNEMQRLMQETGNLDETALMQDPLVQEALAQQQLRGAGIGSTQQELLEQAARRRRAIMSEVGGQ
jgi:hypothetical protein